MHRLGRFGFPGPIEHRLAAEMKLVAVWVVFGAKSGAGSLIEFEVRLAVGGCPAALFIEVNAGGMNLENPAVLRALGRNAHRDIDGFIGSEPLRAGVVF